MACPGRRTVIGRSSDSRWRCPYRQRRRKKKHLIEAAPLGRLHQMLRMTISAGDTSYYNVWSPWPQHWLKPKVPRQPRHDMNLTDLTWPDFQGFLTSFWWLCGFKNVTLKLSLVKTDFTCKSLTNINFCAPSQCFARIFLGHVFTSWLSKTWRITKNMFKNARKSKLFF